ncbi:hypothetical protein GE21DRAFT_1220853, partial [Neurospora crassa]
YKISKHPRNKTLSKLYLIPSVVIDFKLIPIDKRGFNNILIIVDRFLKIF